MEKHVVTKTGPFGFTEKEADAFIAYLKSRVASVEYLKRNFGPDLFSVSCKLPGEMGGEKFTRKLTFDVDSKGKIIIREFNEEKMQSYTSGQIDFETWCKNMSQSQLFSRAHFIVDREENKKGIFY